MMTPPEWQNRPAFPIPDRHEPGLTIRQYTAIEMMKAIVAKGDGGDLVSRGHTGKAAELAIFYTDIILEKL
jgi:hypothetical protein